jgi:hypothetical protein
MKIFKKIFTGFLLSVIVTLTLGDACLETEISSITSQDSLSSLNVDHANSLQASNEIPCAHACYNHVPDICCAGIIELPKTNLKNSYSSVQVFGFDYNVFYQLVFQTIPTPPPSSIS